MARPDDADPAAASRASATPSADPAAPTPVPTPAPAAGQAPRRWSRPHVAFRLPVGSTVSRTFSTWLKSFVPFAILSLAVHSPLIAFTYFSTLRRGDEGWARDIARFELPIAYLSEAVIGSILSGAVAYSVFQRLRGQPAPFGASISRGFESLLRVIGTGLVVAVITLVGLFLLVVPGIIAACTLVAAVPAAVVERTGVRASLSRSAKLTRNQRGAIFGAFFLTGIVTGVATQVTRLVVEIDTAATWEDLATRMALSQGLIALVSPLSAVLGCVIYHDLRIGKEGASADEIASVFD